MWRHRQKRKKSRPKSLDFCRLVLFLPPKEAFSISIQSFRGAISKDFPIPTKIQDPSNFDQYQGKVLQIQRNIPQIQQKEAISFQIRDFFNFLQNPIPRPKSTIYKQNGPKTRKNTPNTSVFRLRASF